MKYMQFFRYTVFFSSNDLLKLGSAFSILISPSTKVLELHGKYYGISLLSLFHVVYNLYIYTFLDIHILQNLTPAETSSD